MGSGVQRPRLLLWPPAELSLAWASPASTRPPMEECVSPASIPRRGTTAVPALLQFALGFLHRYSCVPFLLWPSFVARRDPQSICLRYVPGQLSLCTPERSGEMWGAVWEVLTSIATDKRSLWRLNADIFWTPNLVSSSLLVNRASADGIS